VQGVAGASLSASPPPSSPVATPSSSPLRRRKIQRAGDSRTSAADVHTVADAVTDADADGVCVCVCVCAWLIILSFLAFFAAQRHSCHFLDRKHTANRRPNPTISSTIFRRIHVRSGRRQFCVVHAGCSPCRLRIANRAHRHNKGVGAAAQHVQGQYEEHATRFRR